mmetsp:Transcript_110413/g.356402  ORF Transcript_110413/g.356402 Transcript_110413/m.356402 type:complete len:269 (-) Transcript_110413:92-898(-)
MRPRATLQISNLQTPSSSSSAYSSALLEHSARYTPLPYIVPRRLPARSSRNSLSEMPCTAAAVVPWKSHCSCAAASSSPSTSPTPGSSCVAVSTAGVSSAFARPRRRSRAAEKAIQAALFCTRTTSVTSSRSGISRPLRSLVDLHTKVWSISRCTAERISSGRRCLLTKRPLSASARTSQPVGSLVTSFAAMAERTAAPHLSALVSEGARSVTEEWPPCCALKRSASSRPSVVTSASSANLKASSGGWPDRPSRPGGQKTRPSGPSTK